ncbi:plasminogen-like [Saccoglossus kowalevskii]
MEDNLGTQFCKRNIVVILIICIAVVALIVILVTVLVLTTGHAERELTECYLELDGSDYRGIVNTTIDGNACQVWTSSQYYIPDVWYEFGVDDHNFCRNPDGDVGVWCYTSNPNVRWQYCDIGSPREDCSVTTTARTTVTLFSTQISTNEPDKVTEGEF